MSLTITGGVDMTWAMGGWLAGWSALWVIFWAARKMCAIWTFARVGAAVFCWLRGRALKLLDGLLKAGGELPNDWNDRVKETSPTFMGETPQLIHMSWPELLRDDCIGPYTDAVLELGDLGGLRILGGGDSRTSQNRLCQIKRRRDLRHKFLNWPFVAIAICCRHVFRFLGSAATAKNRARAIAATQCMQDCFRRRPVAPDRLQRTTRWIEKQFKNQEKRAEKIEKAERSARRKDWVVHFFANSKRAAPKDQDAKARKTDWRKSGGQGISPRTCKGRQTTLVDKKCGGGDGVGGRDAWIGANFASNLDFQKKR